MRIRLRFLIPPFPSQVQATRQRVGRVPHGVHQSRYVPQYAYIIRLLSHAATLLTHARSSLRVLLVRRTDPRVEQDGDFLDLEMVSIDGVWNT